MILRRLEGGEWGRQVKERPSGLVVPAEYEQRPTGFDLFCGAGGFSLGVIQAGFEVVGAADNEPAATITYTVNLGTYPMQFHWIEEADKERLNSYLEKDLKRQERALKKASKIAATSPYQSDMIRIPTSGSGHISHNPDIPGVSNFFFGDVRKLSGERILTALGMKRGELGCLFGGPPCQGFSSAGKKNVHDPRNSLLFEFARLVRELEPQTIMMENVPELLNMTTPEGLPVIDVFCKSLADDGFSTYEALRQSLVGATGRRAAWNVSAKGKKEKKAAKKAKVRAGREGSAQGSLFGGQP